MPRQPVYHTHPVKVGIIGAGAAGLIVDSLVDSRITYDIFDADPMKDLEGGVYPKGGGESHYFVSSAFRCPTCPIFIYIFPCSPCGSRVSERSAPPILLDLILRVKNCLVTWMLTVIPYVMDNPNNLNFFDAIVKTNAELSLHPWTRSTRGSTLLVSNIIHVAIGACLG